MIAVFAPTRMSTDSFVSLQYCRSSAVRCIALSKLGCVRSSVVDRPNPPLAVDEAFNRQFAIEGFEQPRFQRFCGIQVKNGVDMLILQQGFLSSSLCRMDTTSASCPQTFVENAAVCFAI